MRCRVFLISLLSVFIMLPAAAFERPFPPIAKRGTMAPGLHPTIVIDGKNRTLSPGARVWNQDNLTETPASLRSGDYTVNYTEDAMGDIDRVWILTKEEAERPLPKRP